MVLTLRPLEWLIANGLGGYASGTLVGGPTRRYHALLAAALPPPLGRVVMLNHVHESLALDGGAWSLRPLEFRLDHGLPVWRCACAGRVIEKTVCMARGRNTVHVLYRLTGGEPAVLDIEPWLAFRRIGAPLDSIAATGYRVAADGARIEIGGDERRPPLTLRLPADSMLVHAPRERAFELVLEAERGCVSEARLWAPGRLRLHLTPGRTAAFTASTETWRNVAGESAEAAWSAEIERRRALVARAHPRAREGFAADLVLAADAFLITPPDAPDERSVIAGYHWFTDWGRDAMVSLEGLALVTGRYRDARAILLTFARYMRDGLAPNLFPEGGRRALYHTSDATLWLFHAAGRYAEVTGDRSLLRELLPLLVDSYEHHLRGTRFGIGVDPRDGLLHEGASDVPLTWMDADADGWIVTPRRGKPVEINALWYNALRYLQGWLSAQGEGRRAADVRAHADAVYDAFNRRFWYARGGYLCDVMDGEEGDDASLRPNQIFAIALPHAVLEPQRWPRVLDVVTRALLTPCGLRTLAPDDPRFSAHYDGDRRARDAAYHQGTVWPWLVGAYVDAWLKVDPAAGRAAHDLVQAYAVHLGDACAGSISEIFDAEPPYAPRGCIAQAWSVAEVLRSLAVTAAHRARACTHRRGAARGGPSVAESARGN